MTTFVSDLAGVEHVGQTGVVGLLKNGDGPTIMLRADMDALPMAEKTGLPYASTAQGTNQKGETVPVDHSCGHDIHTSWLAARRRESSTAPTSLACWCWRSWLRRPAV